MARKRKTRATEEAPQEPHQTEPEPEPPQAAETLEDGPTEIVEEEDEDEEMEEEDEEENNEQAPQITEKPSASENGESESEDEEPLEKLLEPFSKDQLSLLLREAVSKHPDLIDHVRKSADADPAHRKIFVHGLGWDANSDTIASAFAHFGHIEDCKVVKDKVSGKSKGYAFILFKRRAGARRALKDPQKTIDGRLASCQLASAGPVPAPPPLAPPVPSPPVSEYTQRKIYVSNVSPEIDVQKLVDFFSGFGEIEEGPLGLDKQTGKPRGFCLFVYKSVEGAKKALEEPHKSFEGQTLHCQKAVDGPKHTKGYFNQQHGHGHGHSHHHPAKKGKYGGSGGGGHLMAPRGGPSAGYNPAVAPAAIGQAVAALLATQGAGLGIGNLLGGIGNPQGMPPMMNNAGYGGQGVGGYGGQGGMQGGYGGQQQMRQGGVRPHQGGAPPYMGHGH